MTYDSDYVPLSWSPSVLRLTALKTYLAQDVRELLHVEAVAPVETGDGGAVLEGDGGHVGGPLLGLGQVRVQSNFEVLAEAADDDVGLCNGMAMRETQRQFDARQ